MTKVRESELDQAFSALSDPKRRAVIRELLKRPRRAGELAEEVSMSPPALSRHLRVLRRSGLIVEEAIEEDARVRMYRVKPSAFKPMSEWLAQVEDFWRDQLGAFKAHAEKAGRKRGPRP
jgi:DNA-binding transcriptional ArsR family regulator